MSQQEMFFFNGHGTSIPHNYRNFDGNIIPTRINLKPGQIIIMYNDMCALRGSSWVQEIIFNNILASKDPQTFVTNIKRIQSNGKEFFGYFGSLTEPTECPNLSLGTHETLFHKLMSEPDTRRIKYEPRFGLFHSPLNLDNSQLVSIPPALRLQKIRHIKIDKEYTVSDIAQYELINPTTVNDIIFPIYPSTNYIDEYSNPDTQRIALKYTHFDFVELKNIVEMFDDNPFILFMNVCRDTEQGYVYDELPIKDLNSLLRELSGEPGVPSVPVQQAAQAVQVPDLKPYDPNKRESKALTFFNSETGEPIKIKGGNIDYKQKYLKYKQKYLDLKNKI